MSGTWPRTTPGLLPLAAQPSASLAAAGVNAPRLVGQAELVRYGQHSAEQIGSTEAARMAGVAKNINGSEAACMAWPAG